MPNNDRSGSAANTQPPSGDTASASERERAIAFVQAVGVPAVPARRDVQEAAARWYGSPADIDAAYRALGRDLATIGLASVGRLSGYSTVEVVSVIEVFETVAATLGMLGWPLDAEVVLNDRVIAALAGYITPVEAYLEVVQVMLAARAMYVAISAGSR